MRTEPTPAAHAFVFAHPDDEFGCLEILQRLVASGDRVVCVYLTDGAYGGQPAEPRVRESQRVLRKLGVRDEDMHFVGVRHGFPDGQLVASLERAYAALLECLEPYDVQILYTMAWEGGHQDHDAAHLLVLYAARELGVKQRVEQFSLYNGAGLPGPLFHVMHPLPENGEVQRFAMSFANRLRYLGLCMAYPSQWKTWLGLLPLVAPKLLFGRGYALQKADIGRLDEKPHAGALLYERRGLMTWAQFGSAARAFRQAAQVGGSPRQETER